MIDEAKDSIRLILKKSKLQGGSIYRLKSDLQFVIDPDRPNVR